jgi:hypothetical protein
MSRVWVLGSRDIGLNTKRACHQMAVPTQNKKRRKENKSEFVTEWYCPLAVLPLRYNLKPTLNPTSCTLHPHPALVVFQMRSLLPATPCTHLLSLNCGNALNPSEVTSTYIHTHIHAHTDIHTAHILTHTHIHT